MDLKDLNVVILHDWLTGFRGGERVLEALCEIFPDAPIYTLIHSPKTTSEIIESHSISASFLNNVPGISKHYRKFLPLFPLAAQSLKIDGDVDLVLSSSHCVIKGVKKPIGAMHISYLHSPMRYLYDQYDSYFGPSAPFYQRFGMKIFKSYLTNWDQRSNQNVDCLIANSAFVQQRIKHYYGLESDVIHPFVDLSDFRAIQSNPPAKEDYYIMVSAFAPNKRVDLAIEAFNRLEKKLIIIGSGQLERELKAMAGPTITFLGNTSREEVVDNFARAKGMIFPGVEDFGITPLESLAAGTPVIAFRKGGVLETLNEKTACFFDEPNVEALIAALENFERTHFLQEDLYARAESFSRENFQQKMRDFILEKWQERKQK